MVSVAAAAGVAACAPSTQSCPRSKCGADQLGRETQCDVVLGICVPVATCPDSDFCAVVTWADASADLDLHVVELPAALCSSSDCSADECNAEWGAPGDDDNPTFSAELTFAGDARQERVRVRRVSGARYRIAVHVVDASAPVVVSFRFEDAEGTIATVDKELSAGDLWETATHEGALCRRGDEPVIASWTCDNDATFVCE